MKRNTDTLEDLKMQLTIESRAAYSLAILGMAFVEHGSGRFIAIYSDNSRGRIPRLKKLIKQAVRRQERSSV